MVPDSCNPGRRSGARPPAPSPAQRPAQAVLDPGRLLNWIATAAQVPQSYAPQRGQGAVAKAQGPGVEAGGPPVGRRCRRLRWET